jgi:hypothetical protein
MGTQAMARAGGNGNQRSDVRVYGGNDEMELRAGVEPLSQLLDERRHLVDKVADLRAKFGSFGTWDHLRKIEISRLKALVRLEAMQSKAKMTNDMVDEEAHQHPDYTQFVTLATRQRAEWFRLESQIEAIDFKINRGQGLLRFATYEPRS